MNLTNKIIFLGTGGGSSGVAGRTQSCAGTWLNLDGVNMYIDPGPSAVFKISEANLDPGILDIFVLSEHHIDHSGDANALINNAQYAAKKNNKKCKLRVLTPGQCIDERVLQPYFLSLLSETNILKNRKIYSAGEVEISSLGGWSYEHTYQEDIEEYSFIFSGSKSIGYHVEMKFDDDKPEIDHVDIFIQNMTWPEEAPMSRVIESVKKASPRVAILRHWYYNSWEHGPDKLAERVERETGTKTIAARDGDVFDIENMEMIL